MTDTLTASRPPHYGDPAAEYEAARRAAAVIDLGHRGRVRVGGRDRLDLLQRLTTNDLQGLAPGRGVANLFLNNKGRILDQFDALVLADHLLLCLRSAGGRTIAGWIMQFVFMEDVVAEDVTADTAELGIFGPAAGAALGAAGADVSGLAANHPAVRDHRAAEVAGIPVTVGTAEPLAGGGFRLVSARSDAARLWQALVERGRPLGLRPAGAEIEEILRVEAGLLGPGRELSERYNPLEAELRPFVSFTKGCYIGQEVVARLNTYKKLQRVLRGLRLAGDVVPAAEARVLAGGGAEAGQVTSAVRSPALGAPLALAYIESEHAAAGTPLRVELAPDGPAVAAVVLAPPFVP